MASDDESWGGWEEDAEVEVVDLLDASRVHRSVDEALDAAAERGIDVRAIASEFGLDMYRLIVLVNYVRRAARNGDTPSAIRATITREATFWMDEAYLKPVIPQDPLLQRLERLATDADSEDGEGAGAGDSGAALAPAAVESTEEMLKLRVAELEQQVASAKGVIASLTGEDAPASPAAPGGGPTRARPVPSDIDTYYFDSYSHHGIHAVMLQDRARTEAYRVALEETGVCRGRRVLDVGCGTGILSMFAARGGASHVVGVDNSSFADEARIIVERNGLGDAVTVVKGKVEEVELPDGVDKVDVIVSEWMGYCLLFENMLDSVLCARDRFLAEGGIVLPDRARMYLSFACDEEWWARNVTFWSDVYGFDMAHLAPRCVRDPDVRTVAPDCVATTYAEVADIDIMTVSPIDLAFDCEFAVATSRASPLHCVVVHFDTLFSRQCAREVLLSTSPDAEPTHWQQAVFPLPEPLQAEAEGEQLRGRWRFARNAANPREWRVRIRLDSLGGRPLGKELEYLFN